MYLKLCCLDFFFYNRDVQSLDEKLGQLSLQSYATSVAVKDILLVAAELLMG